MLFLRSLSWLFEPMEGRRFVGMKKGCLKLSKESPHFTKPISKARRTL